MISVRSDATALGLRAGGFVVWRETLTAVPAARSDGLLIEPVGDETVIYDTDSRRTHCLRPLAAVVFDCSDGETTIGEISAIAAERLGDSVSEPEVADAVAQLAGLGLLRTGEELVVTGGNGVSRRDMIHRIAFTGAAVAVGSSLITTVAPSTARASASGLPTGCSGCSRGSDCISGACCAILVTCVGQGRTACCVNNLNSCLRVNCTCTNGTTCAAPLFECRPGAGTCSCTCLASGTNTGCGKCPCATCPSGSSSLPCCQGT